MNSLQSPANQSIPSRSFKLAAKYCFMWKISLVLKKKKIKPNFSLLSVKITLGLNLWMLLNAGYI